MIRFVLRATLWIGLFVHLLPGMMGDLEGDTLLQMAEPVNQQDLSKTVAQKITEVCSDMPEICEQGRAAAFSISGFALSTASTLLSVAK